MPRSAFLFSKAKAKEWWEHAKAFIGPRSFSRVIYRPRMQNVGLILESGDGRRRMVIKCRADIYGIEEVLSLACLMPIQDHKEEMDGIAFLAV